MNYIVEGNAFYSNLMESICDESENNGSIYQVGDQLHCDDIENPLDICFPHDCPNELSLSDLYGKVIWIEMTASW